MSEDSNRIYFNIPQELYEMIVEFYLQLEIVDDDRLDKAVIGTIIAAAHENRTLVN